MNNRIEELCSRPVAGTMIPRDLGERPITQAELLDCMLLTAALDRENFVQMKQAVEAMMVCAPNIAGLCRTTLAELRRLPIPALLNDELDLDDRQPEMAAARQALRAMAAANPGQANYLKTAADILEDSWAPLNPDN